MGTFVPLESVEFIEEVKKYAEEWDRALEARAKLFQEKNEWGLVAALEDAHNAEFGARRRLAAILQKSGFSAKQSNRIVFTERL